jgi:hypothetical protein
MTPDFKPRPHWLKLLPFALVVGAFAVLVEPLTWFGFKVADGLAARAYMSRSLAYLLLAWGTWKCWRTLGGRREIGLRDAVSCYLAFGFGMAGVYFLVHETGHGCFQFPDGEVSEPSILDFIYFSFVTVTTVGYGDITPRHTFVRGLILLQVLFGLGLILRTGNQERPSGALPD